MKNNEFKNFMAIAETDGLESDYIQCSGWAWLQLTDRQLKTVKQFALDHGYTADKDGVVTVGAWKLSADVTETVNDFIKENNTMNETEKNEATPDTVEETTTPDTVEETTTPDTVEETTTPDTVEETTAVTETDEKKINATVTRVAKAMDKIEKGYLGVIGDVAYLHETNAHKVTGHKDFYALCADKFHMSRGTVSNLLNIYKRFGENYKLKDEYKEYTVRAMLEQIQNEKKSRAMLENHVNDSVVDNDEDEKQTKSKRETLVDFDFTNVDAWTVDELLEKIREELTAANISEINANANIIFKINN